MLSFLNKDIDITNKTQEEIQESLLTKTQFNSKSKTQSDFFPQQIADDSGNNIFVLIVEVIKNKYKILYSFSGDENSFDELTEDNITKMRNDYLNHTGDPFNIDYLFTKFNVRNRSKLAKEILDIQPNCLLPLSKVKSKPTSSRANAKVIFGWGIDPLDIPHYSKFGKLLINTKKLYYDNILSICDHNHHNVEGFMSTSVSDSFVNFLIQTIKGNNPSISEINTLKSNEQHIYNRLITIAGLKKQYNNTNENTVSELKTRLKILESEL